MIKAWSKTQNSISLSSAEAELIAMVKLSTELLGLMRLARDLDWRLHGRVWADSSAALAVVKRSGAGKLRHINISLLCVQEQEKLKKLVYEKVPGQANPADLFTNGGRPGEASAICLGVRPDILGRKSTDEPAGAGWVQGVAIGACGINADWDAHS